MSEPIGNRLDDIQRARLLHHYEDQTAFFYAKISGVAASLVSYFMTNEFVFLATTIGMLGIMLADIGNIRAHKALVEKIEKNYEAWEYQYTFLSTAFMLMMGIWAFFCFTVSDDLFLHLLCVSISLGNVLSLICRNFSNERILTLQLISVGFPLTLGMLSYGDFRSLILCAFFLPLFSSVRDISGRLRSLFQDIEMQSLEKEVFGTQLNEALESMSHGLIMFDEQMRIRIINKAAGSILDLDQYLDCFGNTLQEVSALYHGRDNTLSKISFLENALAKLLAGKTSNDVFRISDREFVELSVKLRSDGGCVVVIEDVSQRIQFQNQINQLARFDELTGLCNRSFFLQRADALLAEMDNRGEAAVFFIDLDDFKKINDTFGHEAGDMVLTSVAERLRQILPSPAVVGRYGGDEFVAIVQTAGDPYELEALANRIVTDVPTGFTFNKKEVGFGISVGIARFPEDDSCINRLLKLADLALYESKAEGKNRYRIFTSEIECRLEQRIALENNLTQAVKEQSLELHFQPMVSLHDGKTPVFEALTRWKKEGGDYAMPSEFIPVAEDLGLIREIGDWTLLEACRQCRNWPAETCVSVNLSAVQFQVTSVTDAVKKALDQTGLDPSRLEIEITETAVLNDMANAVTVLESLSALGVRISLDDFGTGYSSLSYLHKLPLDKLKVDKSFVDDLESNPRSRTLLKGITVLGKAMDLKIVVEGVETREQFELLKDNYDIDLIQGFYFSRPLPPEDAGEFARAAYPAESGPQYVHSAA